MIRTLAPGGMAALGVPGAMTAGDSYQPNYGSAGKSETYIGHFTRAYLRNHAATCPAATVRTDESREGRIVTPQCRMRERLQSVMP